MRDEFAAGCNIDTKIRAKRLVLKVRSVRKGVSGKGERAEDGMDVGGPATSRSAIPCTRVAYHGMAISGSTSVLHVATI